MVKVLTFAAVFLMLAAPVRADTFMKVGYVSLAAVSMADLELTGRGLERGLKESNPLLKPFAGSPGAAGLVSGALSAGIGIGAYRLDKDGKKKQARILLFAWTALRAVVVVHNIRELRK